MSDLAARGNATEVRVTASSGGEKGQKLARMDQIPPSVLYELGEHTGKGTTKYADKDGIPNYRYGYAWGLSYQAAMRHMLQFWDGEDLDEETGSKHVICAMWHMGTLAIFMDEHRDFDDRVSTIRARLKEAEGTISQEVLDEIEKAATVPYKATAGGATHTEEEDHTEIPSSMSTHTEEAGDLGCIHVPGRFFEDAATRTFRANCSKCMRPIKADAMDSSPPPVTGGSNGPASEWVLLGEEFPKKEEAGDTEKPSPVVRYLKSGTYEAVDVSTDDACRKCDLYDSEDCDGSTCFHRSRTDGRNVCWKKKTTKEED